MAAVRGEDGREDEVDVPRSLMRLAIFIAPLTILMWILWSHGTP